MNPLTSEELAGKNCTPCEGGVALLSDDEARAQALLQNVEGWEFAHGSTRIRRRWTAKNFAAAMEFLNKVATLAEEQGHHPDLHLEGYRMVTIELWTHAIGGLSENDFIVAAKINRIPIAIKR